MLGFSPIAGGPLGAADAGTPGLVGAGFPQTYAIEANVPVTVGAGFPQTYAIEGDAIPVTHVAPSRTVNFDGGTNRVAFDGGTNRVDF